MKANAGLHRKPVIFIFGASFLLGDEALFCFTKTPR